MPAPTAHLVDRAAAIRAQRTTGRDPTATGLTCACLWCVAATALRAWCAWCAGQYGRRCCHLAVAVDEELCGLEAQRVSGAYATAKHGQAS